MKWQNLTSSELDAFDRATPLFLSIAAVEQHGPHLPMGTDALIGQYFLDQLDTRLGNDVLILPPVSVGYSVHHLDYPGTLSVGHSALGGYVRDLVDSALTHGFRNFVLFNSHAGNVAVAGILLEELGTAHPDRKIVLANWWKLVAPEIRALQANEAGGDSRAGDMETSIMLHIAGDAVRPIDAGIGAVPALFPWADGDLLTAERATLYASMRDRTAGSGVAGTPRKASAAKGAIITSLVIDALVDVAVSLKNKP
jgi:creatinine amidohydrolase